jgi:predicted PurR-regulated permease PerM
LLIDQIRQFVTNFPDYADRARSFAADILNTYFPDLATNDTALQNAVAELRQKLQAWSGGLLNRLWVGGLAVVDFLAIAVITPVVAFYLLLDWDNMIAEINEWLPRQHKETIKGLAREVDQVLAGFVRGQLTVCTILGTFYALALVLIGLDFGLLIGFFAGLISFIPYVGVIFGGALSLGVALFQFWNDPVWIAAVAAVFAIGQVVEGNYLTPKLVGGSVGLHPVWLLFALAAFGSVLGFTGLLIAVPAAAVIGVLGRFGLRQYMASRLFLGADDSDGDGPKPPGGGLV